MNNMNNTTDVPQDVDLTSEDDVRSQIIADQVKNQILETVIEDEEEEYKKWLEQNKKSSANTNFDPLPIDQMSDDEGDDMTVRYKGYNPKNYRKYQ